MIHLLNGEYFKDFLIKHDLAQGRLLCCNEMFVEGPLYSDILNSDFFQARETYLHREYNISKDIIKEKCSDLKELLKLSNEAVTLWFDEDMYCQINLLVLLAYFNQVRYEGELRVKIIAQDFSSAKPNEACVLYEVVNPPLQEAEWLYHQVINSSHHPELFENNQFTLFEVFPKMRLALQNYTSYQQCCNALTDFIKQYPNHKEDELIGMLLSQNKHLGLTDMQYRRLIKKVRV